MRWMTRLEEKLAITRGEAFALAVIGAIYLAGLAVQHVQRQARTVPDSFYAEVDRALQAAEQADSVGTDERRHKEFAAATIRLDLNTATPSELERLPRIGPTLAARIVTYREEHGPFRRVRDLIRVSGIGEKTLARLEPMLYIGRAH
ncbi:MAG TPA: helix-hairpin-helix domain-containing protein [Rhodothermales bacterium]|nr:helix-hairpin-helix domain-containing protein [Rhodothermales bacterium]